ncbi:MAG TPA: hypothetical protein VGQ13_00735 [Nitrososphaera sp.]|nr:hypothetical protein [Nitrososphaera sp.]
MAKKQAIIKPTKEIKQSPNPYERFLKNNKPASIEDLTKYFELRTSRFSTRFTAGVAVALSLFALLLTAYYQAIQQSISIDRLVLGNIVSGVFVGAAITLMVFLWKNLAAMSDSNFDKHFGWYLEAKSHFKTSQQSPILEAAEINPNPPQVEEIEAAEETDITDESNNLEDSEELRKFLSKLESAAGSA